MIMKTTDYEMFKKVLGNRELNPGHLAKLAMSIAKRNLLEYSPIMVNESMEVIDGQHRLEVARQNKLPIYYTIVPKSGLDDVVEINTILRNWKLVDFVDSMIVTGNKTMQYLREFCDEFQLSLTSGMILHGNRKGGGNSNRRIVLQRMVFTDIQKRHALQAADLLYDIRQQSNHKGATPRSVVLACLSMAEDGNAKKVSDAIKARGKMIAITADVAKMQDILESYLTK